MDVEAWVRVRVEAAFVAAALVAGGCAVTADYSHRGERLGGTAGREGEPPGEPAVLPPPLRGRVGAGGEDHRCHPSPYPLPQGEGSRLGGILALPRILSHVAVPFALLSATDEAPDEIEFLLRPRPVRSEAAGPARRESSTTTRTGLMAGVMMTGESDGAWKDVPLGGLVIRRVPRGERRKGRALEFGATYSAAETDDGSRSSTLYQVRADLLFGKFGGKGTTLYFLLGAQGVYEESVNNVSGLEETGQGGGLEAGVGLGSRSGRWDLRGTYTYLLATENTKAGMLLTMGLAF